VAVRPVLYDAVTLRHFATVSRLDLLFACHSEREEPRWTATVKKEVSRAADLGRSECRSILEMSWLGEPVTPAVEDLRAIARLRVALGNAGFEAEDEASDFQHLGEAESIQVALRFDFCFVTDDNDAYSLAKGRLDSSRVFDTVDLLRLAVANGDLKVSGAIDVANRIRVSGRYLRHTYDRLLTPADFW
jgi:predicted nucleic acid-binding protein